MGKKVLVVEDDPSYVNLIKDVFSNQSIRVVSASNGAKALELLEANPVDLIISDIEMPVMDGLTFHSRVRESNRFRKIPFAFLTGTTDPIVIKSIHDRPNTRLLFKSNLVNDLLNLVAELK
jgi:two-component system chemotaxis response regulator CheY